MTNETIADIVREIREDDGVRMEFPGMVKAVPNIWILKWCDRIEAAAKRENDRFRAALKPVLKADLPSSGRFPYKTYSRKYRRYGLWDCNGDSVMSTDGYGISSCVNAVREAQRIYREGVKK